MTLILMEIYQMDLSSLPELLTAKQAAKILFGNDEEVGRNRIYDWIRHGDIDAAKRSNQWWITKTELERVMK